MKILLSLLDYFEDRNDTEIRNMVTDNADVPTIFEYVLGILWYKASERQGKILDYMKLSLTLISFRKHTLQVVKPILFMNIVQLKLIQNIHYFLKQHLQIARTSAEWKWSRYQDT